MTGAHTPKVMALEAYAERRLSALGSLRVERHLSVCSECRCTLDAIESYASLRLEAQAEATPELTWERFEQALDSSLAPPPVRFDQAPVRAEGGTESAAPGSNVGSKVIASFRSRARRRASTLWPVLAVAATVVFAFLAYSERRDAPLATRSLNPPVEVAAEEAKSQGWITLVAADVQLEVDGVRAPAQAGQVVLEGTRFYTGKNSEVHVALTGGGGLVVEAESQVALTRLREHSVELTLHAGQVFQQVRKLGEAERYEVAFGPYVARVRGTRFRVIHGARSQGVLGRASEASSVSVNEGRVVVHQAEQLIADLSAGQNWSSQIDTQASVSLDRRVHGTDPGSRDWPTLTLPALANVGAWRIDDAALSAQGSLAMRLPAGDVSLTYEDLKGRQRPLSLQLAPEGSTLNEAEIRALMATQNDPQGHLDPEQISPVVRAGLDPLRRCYERGLKRDPGLVGKLVLSIRVAPDGHVARASLDEASGPALPLDVESCMQTEARGWVFPKPSGGSVVFEVPLNLKSSLARPRASFDSTH